MPDEVNKATEIHFMIPPFLLDTALSKFSTPRIYFSSLLPPQKQTACEFNGLRLGAVNLSDSERPPGVGEARLRPSPHACGRRARLHWTALSLQWPDGMSTSD